MRLLVTADDLGLHRGMNEGAVRAHREGIVTACSVSANGRALDDAVERLAECPELECGAHLTLVEERPVLPPAEVPTLVGPTGRFHRNWVSFASRFSLGLIDPDEVEAELDAQIDLLHAKGLQIVHLNGHQHLHLLPGVFERVVAIARRRGIGYVRVPNDTLHATLPITRRLPMRMLNALGRVARKHLGSDVVSCDRTIGIAGAGHLSSTLIAELADEVAGLTELVVHPGVNDAEIGETYDWGYAWDGETEALCDPVLREEIDRRGIELVRVRLISSN